MPLPNSSNKHTAPESNLISRRLYSWIHSPLWIWSVTQPWWNRLSSPATACDWKAMVEPWKWTNRQSCWISYAHVV
jgi:hypothetical protein